MRMHRYLLIFGLLLIMLSGCGKEPRLTAYEARYLDCFDTVTSVTISAESEAAFQELDTMLHEELRRYHQLFDIYNSYDGINNIKTINDNAGIQPVKVDEDIIRLLELSVEQYKETDGMVNVAMGSVLSVWHDYRDAGMKKPEQAKAPEMELLRRADRYTDIDQIVIDKKASTVFLPESSMKLDVGAIAKGYAVEKVCERLREQGVTSAMLSAGGNVRTIGVRADGKPWRIGIQNPDTGSKVPYLHVVALQDMSLVTSGSYQRFYEVDGKRYHHIINPETLMPEDQYASVTILCQNSATADALSTAVFNLSLEKGRELVEGLENTEAIWVMPDGSEVVSSGFEAYLDE